MTIKFTQDNKFITVENFDAEFIFECLRFSEKITDFLKSKCPTKDQDFCFRTWNEKGAIFRYTYSKDVYGMELMAFIESIDDSNFKKCSKQDMLKELFDAFHPRQRFNSKYSGSNAIDKIIYPISNIVNQNFKPKTELNYTRVSTSTCESSIYFKGKRVSDARTYSFYYEFDVNVTIDEMINYLVKK